MCATDASLLPDTSAFFRYFSMLKALSSPTQVLLCSVSNMALWSASGRICSAERGSSEQLTAGPAGRFLALLLLDSSMIMAASCDGSVLMDASAMAEAIVLILSIRWLLLLLGDTQLWLPKLDSEPEPSLWSGGATRTVWSSCSHGSGSVSPLGDILSPGASKVLSRSSGLSVLSASLSSMVSLGGEMSLGVNSEG